MVTEDRAGLLGEFDRRVAEFAEREETLVRRKKAVLQRERTA